MTTRSLKTQISSGRLNLHLPQANDAQPIENFDERIHRVKLKPFAGEVGAARVHVMIVMQAFTPHQKINIDKVGGSVFKPEVRVADSMRKPVDNNSVKRSHDEMERENKIHPPLRGEEDIERGVSCNPDTAREPAMSEAVQPFPVGQVF